VLGLATALQWLIAVVLFVVIAAGGLWFLKAMSGLQPKEHITPEDVQDLDVFFVCDECGTELQVTRLGEVQVPRHCGEPMRVERRARPT
jgi:hypothetical protein